jgi:hypothetical protein
MMMMMMMMMVVMMMMMMVVVMMMMMIDIENTSLAQLYLKVEGVHLTLPLTHYMDDPQWCGINM